MPVKAQGGAGRKAPVTSAGSVENPREVARRAREELYREHILRAAEAVFADQGFEAAKLQDISKLAGLSMGSIYSLFESKEALFGAIVQQRGLEIRDLVTQLVNNESEPRATLEALARLYIDYFFDRPDFLRMNLRTGAAWGLNATYAGHQEQLSDEIHALHRDIFARGVAAGAFVDEDPSFLARLFTGIDQTHLADWVSSGMKISRDELKDRLLRVIRRAFLRSS